MRNTYLKYLRRSFKYDFDNIYKINNNKRKNKYLLQLIFSTLVACILFPYILFNITYPYSQILILILFTTLVIDEFQKYLSINIIKNINEYIDIEYSQKIMQEYNVWNKLRMKNDNNCFMNKMIVLWTLIDIILLINININLQIIIGLSIVILHDYLYCDDQYKKEKRAYNKFIRVINSMIVRE